MTTSIVPLAEIVKELENGSRPEGGVDDSGDVFSVGGEHLNDFGNFDFSSVKLISHAFYQQMKRGKIKPHDIIIVKDGATTGKTSFVTEQFPHFPCAINEHVFRLSIKLLLADPKYVFYYLYSPKGNREILDDFRGATVGGISQDFVNKVFIPLPSLAEQHRIAGLLARADRLRRLRRYARELSDTYLQSVFVEMFGYPVRNERGWEIVTLKELVRQKDTINYGVVQPGDDYPGGVPIVRVGDFDDIPENTNNLKRIDPAIEANYKRSRLKGDEILIACVGSIGKIALIDKRLKGFNIVRATARVPVGNSINRLFLASYLKTQFVQDYFAKETRTVSQPTLNIEHIEETPVPLPPFSEQERFADVVSRYERLRAQQSEAERQAEMLFQSLLAQAFA